jgi:hypothetical protein
VPPCFVGLRKLRDVLVGFVIRQVLRWGLASLPRCCRLLLPAGPHGMLRAWLQPRADHFSCRLRLSSRRQLLLLLLLLELSQLERPRQTTMGTLRGALPGDLATRISPGALPVSSLPKRLARAGVCPRPGLLGLLLLPCITTDAATTAHHINCATVHSTPLCCTMTWLALHCKVPTRQRGGYGTVLVSQKWGGPALAG